MRPDDPRARHSGPAAHAGFVTVFLIFLRLGLTSFGGAAAHIGFFQDEFVRRRRWLTDATYAELVALCQLLPGPASSQVGLAIGLLRGGYRGAAAAWLGFTLPSAVVMAGFALGMNWWPDAGDGGWVTGLKLFVVAVVAHAVWQMGRSLCPDATRLGIAVVAAALLLVAGSALAQVAVLVVAGVAGWWLALPVAGGIVEGTEGAEGDRGLVWPGSRQRVFWFGGLFLILLLLSLMPLATGSVTWLAAEMYRAGALVFGGGHVVLPLLQEGFVGSGHMPADTFLAGYGVTQAVPGPLFTFSAFLGAAEGGGLAGAVVAVVAVFLPGALLVFAGLPLWQRLRGHRAARSALAGVNAAVVGLLLAALFDPVWTSAVYTTTDFSVILVIWAALTLWRVPVWLLAPLCALFGAFVL